MKNLKSTLLVIFIVTQTITLFLLFTYKNGYENTIKDLESHNFHLTNKIKFMEVNFDNLIGKKITGVSNKRQVSNFKTKTKDSKHKNTNPIKDKEEIYFSFEKEFDLVKNLPNRSGDDLINSLTLKVNQ